MPVAGRDDSGQSETRGVARQAPDRSVGPPEDGRCTQLGATPPGERRRGPSAGKAAWPTRRSDTDPEPDMDGGRASVRNVRSKCRCSHVLQFTFRRAVCCVLHRPPSQVIHCTVLFSHHSLSLSCNCRALTGREPLALGAATATAHDDNTGSVASAVRTSRRLFLGRPWRARRGPGRGRATWGSRGRLGGPRTKDPEVRASADNRLVLPRPVPAAVRVRVGATPLRQTGRTVAPGVGEDSCSAARRDARRRLQRRRRRPRGASRLVANDPTAGSPTVTLLRLLLPLNAQVWKSSRADGGGRPRKRPAPRGPVQMPH